MARSVACDEGERKSESCKKCLFMFRLCLLYCSFSYNTLRPCNICSLRMNETQLIIIVKRNKMLYCHWCF